MSATTKILDRLQRVKQTRPDHYIAACPCCQSKNGRPLSVRSLDDGRVLLHAFCGCETEVVLDAIGLQFADLFDKPLAHHLPPVRGGLTARELLEVWAHETFVAVLLVHDATNRALTEAERERLMLASARLGKAQAMIHAH